MDCPTKPPPAALHQQQHTPAVEQGYTQAVAKSIYGVFHQVNHDVPQQPPTAATGPKGQAKPPPPTLQSALEAWRASDDNTIPEWFGRMTQNRYDYLITVTPPPQPKAPLALHVANNFEPDFDPLVPTSCTTGARSTAPTNSLLPGENPSSL